MINPLFVIILFFVITLAVILFVVVIMAQDKNNIISGSALFALITSIGFILYPDLFLIFFGDIYLTLGAIVSIYFTFRKRSLDQSFIKLGIIVGLSGAALSAVIMSSFEWLIFSIYYSFNMLVFGYYLLLFLPFSLFIGFLVGLVFGYLYKRRETRELEEESDSLL